MRVLLQGDGQRFARRQPDGGLDFLRPDPRGHSMATMRFAPNCFRQKDDRACQQTVHNSSRPPLFWPARFIGLPFLELRLAEG